MSEENIPSSGESNSAFGRNWDPDAVKQAIDLELMTMEDDNSKSYESLAIEKMRQASPFAAEVVLRLAMYGETEQMRFKAATYILDHTIGKATDEPISIRDDKDTVLGDLMSVVSRAN